MLHIYLIAICHLTSDFLYRTNTWCFSVNSTYTSSIYDRFLAITPALYFLFADYRSLADGVLKANLSFFNYLWFISTFPIGFLKLSYLTRVYYILYVFSILFEIFNIYIYYIYIYMCIYSSILEKIYYLCWFGYILCHISSVRTLLLFFLYIKIISQIHKLVGKMTHLLIIIYLQNIQHCENWSDRFRRNCNLQGMGTMSKKFLKCSTFIAQTYGIYETDGTIFSLNNSKYSI